MQLQNVDGIRHSVEAARQIAHTTGSIDSCDAGDLDELIDSVEQELRRGKPNAQILTMYLNSLARSLRSFESARSVCLELDAAMRSAGLPTDWEH